jgi:hypothetical protein
MPQCTPGTTIIIIKRKKKRKEISIPQQFFDKINGGMINVWTSKPVYL